MAIEVTPANLTALNVMLVSLFDEGLTEAELEQSAIMETAFVGPSGSAANIYTFHPNQARLIKKLRDSDELKVRGVNVYSQRVENDRREDVVEVHRDHIADDLVGQYAGMFSDLGRATALAPSQALEQVHIDGTDTTLGLCYDGHPFFSGAANSEAHPIKPFQSGSATQVNWLVQAAGLTFTTFATGYATMEGFQGEDGKSAGSRPNLLLVSPEYRGIGMDICYNDRPSTLSGGGNPWLGKCDLMVIQNWTGLNRWELIDNRQPRRRPFVRQEREAFALYSQISDTDESVFARDTYRYKVTGRDGTGYGYWYKALLSTLA